MDIYDDSEQIKMFSRHLEENKKKIKHIQANRIYPSHPEINQSALFWKPENQFKSTSMIMIQTPFGTGENSDLEKDEFCKDTCTQTSKTILQLARLESDGQISPDSLMQSPRDEFITTSTNKLLDFVPTKLKGFEEVSSNENTSDSNYPPQNHISYCRKNSMNIYLNNMVHNKGDSDILKFNCEKLPKAGKECESTLVNQRKKSPASNIRSKFLQQSSPLRNIIKKPCSPVNVRLNNTKQSRFNVKSVGQRASADILVNPVRSFANIEKLPPKPKTFPPDFKTKRSNSFMSPTIASEIKSKQQEINNINTLIQSTRRGRSSSPAVHKISNRVEKFALEEIPYIDVSEKQTAATPKCETSPALIETSCRIQPPTAKIAFEDDLLRIDNLSLNIQSSDESIPDETVKSKDTNSFVYSDNAVYSAIAKLRSSEWTNALKGLAEIVDLARLMDTELIYPHMTYINQRLIELLKSPRSHVCRTACQAAGHLFESVKDVRRPEFDDIVDILLFKTADANKFIRQDANLALDCMVTHIPTFHAIRTLCSKGPDHKNPLVRTATIRLIVCAVVIVGADVILNINNNEHTRKRVILHMYKFLEDRNLETRKYGERLYKILCKETNFDMFLRKYLEKEQIHQMKKNLKFFHSRK